MSIYLGLGSNLGDKEMNLVTARDLLMKHDVLVVGQSEVRETEPLGGLDQPMYLNQVIEVATGLDPEKLLLACKLVEKEMGREDVVLPSAGNVSFGAPVKRDPSEYQSRIIDIDVLHFNDVKQSNSVLTLPHPGNIDRDFVMAGLRDLDPTM
jgi:2-amino-4-hydroxy-6-hydroxymethyldihydropteridine diphosphokinase